MTFQKDEPYGFHRFLDKFRILDKIKWDEELIDGSIATVCEEIEKENLDFCWMDFSINKYMEHMNWHKKEAIQFIHSSFQHYRPNKVGLILSLKYESMQASQRQYAKLIDDPDVVDLMFGLDLVGDEGYIDHDFHGEVLLEWKKAGKMTRAHVGEYGPCVNIKAVLPFVSNIAHGLKIVDDQRLIKFCIDSEIVFDLGISSNYYTGVVELGHPHPLHKMLDAGLQLTIGSDDPIVCNTTLANEFALAKSLEASDDQLLAMKINAIKQTEFFIKHKLNLWETKDETFESPTDR